MRTTQHKKKHVVASEQNNVPKEPGVRYKLTWNDEMLRLQLPNEMLRLQLKNATTYGIDIKKKY